MDLLEELDLRSTFFVEGLNAELYPEALLGIADAGHELGYHGWRHEYWPDLGRSDEARALERGVHKMQEIGVRPRGFRPSGGRLSRSSPELLERPGFHPLLAGGHRHRLPRWPGRLAFRVAAERCLPLSATLRRSPEDLQGFGRAAFPDRFGGL